MNSYFKFAVSGLFTLYFHFYYIFEYFVRFYLTLLLGSINYLHIWFLSGFYFFHYFSFNILTWLSLLFSFALLDVINLFLP